VVDNLNLPHCQTDFAFAAHEPMEQTEAWHSFSLDLWYDQLTYSWMGWQRNCCKPLKKTYPVD
jgi:hypothetical protein